MTEKINELLEKRDFRSLKELLVAENGADIAMCLEEADEKKALLLFRLLPKELAAETFTYMHSDSRIALINAFNDGELRAVLSELYVDDAVDLIEEMPANVVTRILVNTDEATRRDINKILSFPEDSAGSVMTTEYVTIPENISCDEALQTLRRVGIDKETIYTCYVTDQRKLIGVVTVKDMLISSENSVIGDIMERNIISVSAYEDKETAARMFDKYDFLALPVVDNEQRIIGIITVDDALDVIRDEDSEDFEVMAAMTPTDKPYLKMGVFQIVFKRVPWLLLLMVSATFTGTIISSFEEALGALPVLTAYIPMLMDTGGNAGGQASATIVRGLALNEIKGSDIFKIIFKETRVAIISGIILSVVNFAKIMLFDKLVLGHTSITVSVAFAVCVTLALTVIIAKIVGCTLPIAAKKMGLDPAVMASPFITTIVDALALLAYFKVSVIFIGELG